MILQVLALSIPLGVEWLLVFVVLIFLYFWVKTIIEILKREMPFTNKIAWLLVVFFTGILGLVIYKISEMINFSEKESTQKIVYTD
ncbi:MAG: PLDc N-terminal domain-containing protein [Chitinophagaceae bacterium]|nr:PLDc N-terminal domain-containing protein [Chitinophagaceae bacterium]